MEIVMLGQSNAGKTAYVSAMYGEFSRAGNVLSIRAQRSAHGQRLLQNARRIKRGEYPPGTDRMSSYNLTLLYEGEDLWDFVWKDYRGGALLEPTASKQAAQLRRDIETANALVLMIDSTELLADTTHARAHVRPLVSTTVRLLSGISTTMPLVVVLTKYDLVSDREDEIVERAVDVLGPLVKAVAATHNIHGLLVSVSCGQHESNVSLPVLWCLHVATQIEVQDWLRRLDKRVELYNQAIATQGLTDSVRSWWRNEPSAAQQALTHEAQYQQERATALAVAQLADALQPVFEGQFTF